MYHTLGGEVGNSITHLEIVFLLKRKLNQLSKCQGIPLRCVFLQLIPCSCQF